MTNVNKKKLLRITLSKDLEELSPFSDTPTIPVIGKHLLFAGCSFTSGDSLEKEQTWAWKLYDQLTSSQKNKDTFFNVAGSGMSITESINQVFKYCHNFGNPDAIFLLLPSPGRDGKHCGNSDQGYESLQILIYTSYFYLESFCKTNNIQLIASTWYKNIKDIGDEFLPSKEVKYYPGTKTERPDWSVQLNEHDDNLLENILKDFDTFKTYTEKELISKVSEYHILKDKQDREYSLVAKDDIHPGTSFHDFWKDFFYSFYVEDQC
jgi:hypothetical protein